MKTETTNTQTTPTATTAQDAPKVKVALPSFDNTRHYGLTCELFWDSIRMLKLTPKQAERLARSYQNDMGLLPMDVKSIGGMKKLSKYGTMTLRESLHAVKDYVATPATKLAGLIQMLSDARKLGAESFGVRLNDEMVSWLDREERK